MRIVMIATDPSNGLLYYPVRLALAFRQLGHDVHLLGGTSNRAQASDLAEILTIAGITLHRDHALDSSGITALLGRSEGLRALVRRLNPDAIHAFGPVSLVQAVAPWSRSKPLRVAMIAAMGHGARTLFPARAGAILLRAGTDRVIAQCADERDRLLLAGVPRSRLSIVFNPVDCDDLENRAVAAEGSTRRMLREIGIPAGVLLVVMLANFQPRKRHDLALDAFARSAPQNAILILAGEGSTRRESELRASRPDLIGRVFFPGRLHIDIAIALLRLADVVIHTSVAETFGYSMVEPLLFSRPTVVTKVAIGREIEAADAAIVVPPGDCEALSRGLATALAGGPIVNERARRAAAWVRSEFDINTIGRRLVAVYQDERAG